jgi:hypothetical protein
MPWGILPLPIRSQDHAKNDDWRNDFANGIAKKSMRSARAQYFHFACFSDVMRLPHFLLLDV